MKTTERTHSEEQAEAQLSSIKEMVRAMDRETAAEDYAASLSREECAKVLGDHGCYNLADETDGECREHVADLLNRERIELDGFKFDEEAARERIQEDALSVEVRKGWYTPGDEPKRPTDFTILLCTGGPAVRLIGELNEHGEPDSVRMEHQDWGTPWQELITNTADTGAMLAYACQFYFGE